jgi:glyoxylate/hydroxypyruvate reductase A
MQILITSYLEPEHVEAIAASHPDVEVLYDPSLIGVPQYVADHHGPTPELSPADQQRWEDLLARAEVAFDFDWQDPAALPRRAPNLKWVQATSAGIGAFMRRTGLDRSGIVATTAGGVHAVPLAEFALTGALFVVKGLPDLQRRQRERRFERYTTRQLAGMRVTVVGVGGMGSNVVRTFDAIGARVTAVGRVGGSYELPEGVELSDVDRLEEVLPGTEVLVLCTALTPETENLISAERIALLPEGAAVVNISRGQVIDEDALIDALRSGRLGGAALDVFREEPLPADSPLWDLDNVLISPHSASTVESENATLTALFIENLARYRAGEALLNRFDADRGY